ncbi:MAG TPA: hypothetical protein IAB79_07855 [Candidatus Faecousia excrementipullorum]|nr:hypothetical protein [Candidatus Faecousia excrementipullorum]
MDAFHPRHGNAAENLWIPEGNLGFLHLQRRIGAKGKQLFPEGFIQSQRPGLSVKEHLLIYGHCRKSSPFLNIAPPARISPGVLWVYAVFRE